MALPKTIILAIKRKNVLFIGCKDEDVRHTEVKESLMFMNDKFHPICGNWFWDDRHGSDLFCRKLGYDKAKKFDSRYDLPADGVSLGRCPQDAKHFDSCTHGVTSGEACTLFQIGCKDNVKHCIPGNRMGMNIECEGGDGRRSSCQGNHSSHFVFYSKNVRLSAREWAFILILTKVIFCKPCV